MSPQMIQKLPAITVEGISLELSTNQLKVQCFYAMGVPYDAIVLRTVGFLPKRYELRLKRSLKNLNLEGYDAPPALLC